MNEIIQIDADTWRVEDGGVRFFVFRGARRTVLIDTGMNTPDAKKIAQDLTGLDVILINTHADPDHISGNGSFESFYMSPDEEDNYRAHGGTGTLIPVREGDVIDPGDRPLRIIDIPGHTPGSIAVLDEKNRVLVSGDSVQNGNIFMFGQRRDIDRYTESLKHLAEYGSRFDVIYPMHGDFPVTPGLTGKLIEGAELIRAGKTSGVPVDRLGVKAYLYRFPYAGFLCDAPDA